jgi:hypothetical protein
MLHEVGSKAQVGAAPSKVSETDLFGITTATMEVFMPSGFTCIIRESTGEDEDLLSRMKDTQDGTAMHNYLANIIIGGDKYPAPVSASTVATWKVRDIYYLLYKARILTHGKEVFFDHTFEDGTSIRVKENLDRYDVDLTKGPDQEIPKGAITPYKDDADYAQAVTASGKKYRFKFLTGQDELKSLTLDTSNLSINDKLRMRDFQLQDAHGKWHVIERFNILSARDTSEIRSKLDKIDPEFMLISDVKHPSKPSKEEVSLFAVPGFFFPQS